MSRKFRIDMGNGKVYRLNGEELNVGWNIMDRRDKQEVASLYLENYCKFDIHTFTCDEWVTCVDVLMKLYTRKFNSGANDAIWKSACDEFMSMWEKGDIF